MQDPRAFTIVSPTWVTKCLSMKTCVNPQEYLYPAHRLKGMFIPTPPTSVDAKCKNKEEEKVDTSVLDPKSQTIGANKRKEQNISKIPKENNGAFGNQNKQNRKRTFKESKLSAPEAIYQMYKRPKIMEEPEISMGMQNIKGNIGHEKVAVTTEVARVQEGELESVVGDIGEMYIDIGESEFGSNAILDDIGGEIEHRSPSQFSKSIMNVTEESKLPGEVVKREEIEGNEDILNFIINNCDEQDDDENIMEKLDERHLDKEGGIKGEFLFQGNDEDLELLGSDDEVSFLGERKFDTDQDLKGIIYIIYIYILLRYIT